MQEINHDWAKHIRQRTFSFNPGRKRADGGKLVIVTGEVMNYDGETITRFTPTIEVLPQVEKLLNCLIQKNQTNSRFIGFEGPDAEDRTITDATAIFIKEHITKKPFVN